MQLTASLFKVLNSMIEPMCLPDAVLLLNSSSEALSMPLTVFSGLGNASYSVYMWGGGG